MRDVDSEPMLRIHKRWEVQPCKDSPVVILHGRNKNGPKPRKHRSYNSHVDLWIPCVVFIYVAIYDRVNVCFSKKPVAILLLRSQG
jgi:hypothetical protein